LRGFRRPGSGGHLTNAVCGTPARGPACRSVAASGGARWAGPGAGPRGAGRASRPGPFSPGRLAVAGLGADVEHPYAVLVAGMTGTPYVFPKRSCAADLGPKLYARPPDLSRLAYPLPYNFGPKLGGAPGMAGRVKRMWSLGRARFTAGPYSAWLTGGSRLRLLLSLGPQCHRVRTCAPRHPSSMNMRYLFLMSELKLQTYRPIDFIVCSPGRGAPQTAHDDGFDPRSSGRRPGPDEGAGSDGLR
jgi:hypothetical protein